jgi:hypothetical protein
MRALAPGPFLLSSASRVGNKGIQYHARQASAHPAEREERPRKILLMSLRRHYAPACGSAVLRFEQHPFQS